MAMPGPLDGKVAIVTGAASPIGLGHAIALAFVRAGARAVQTTIAELGGLHILVNNAGLHHSSAIGNRRLDSEFWKIPPEVWSRVIAINLSGPFFLARAVTGHLTAQTWGRIIGVTTSMDTMYRKGGAPYGPSKAGHEAFVATI